MVTEAFRVALQVADALERCGVRYVVGGSLASSVSGEPRSTLDVDLVVALEPGHVGPLLALLADSFYADAETLRALGHGGRGAREYVRGVCYYGER